MNISKIGSLYGMACCLLVGISSQSAMGGEVKLNGKTWHVVQGAATSSPILIEKSPDPAFGKKQKRNENVDKSIEKFMILQPSSTTATSTPFAIHEEDGRSIDPLHFNFSVINNTCMVEQGSRFAGFEVCNEEKYDVKILELVSNPFSKILSPTLPTIISSGLCMKISIVGNDKRPFDCSGIYGLSFYAQMNDSKYHGYFGASIVK